MKRWMLWIWPALLAVLLAGCADEVPEEASPEAPPASALPAGAVAAWGTETLDNTALCYEFWSEYYYLTDRARGALSASLDPERPLTEQPYDETQSWEDFILEQALDTARTTMALVHAAEDAGFTLPASYEASLERVRAAFRTQAESAGFADLDAYLRASYGPGASAESFDVHLARSYLAAAYADALRDGPAFTAAEIEEYYDTHAADYAERGIEKNGEAPRNIRLVLLPPETDDAAGWSAAEASAVTLHATWRAESGHEADFAAIADACGAADGGLRENLYPGSLDDALEAWVFDPARAAGDSTTLRTAEGWAIVCYTGTAAGTMWQCAAEADLRWQTYQDSLRELLDQETFVVDYAAISISAPESEP